MTHAPKSPPLLIALALIACFTSACASSARQSESRAPTTAETTADSRPSSDSTAEAVHEHQPAESAAAANGEVEGTSEETQSVPQENFDEDGHSRNSGEAAPTEPALSGSNREKKKVSLVGELQLQVLNFNESVKAETLSCDGAKPFKDAICSLAGRICEMEVPSTVQSADCTQAQESCEKAKKHYQAKCG